MIKIDISSLGTVIIQNIVLDFNGTIANDGKLDDILRSKILKLHELGFKIYIITADTNETVKDEIKDLPVKIRILNPGDEEKEKLKILESIGAENSFVMGNGRNDILMVKKAKIGVGVIGEEGISGKLMSVCDIIVTSPMDGLDLLLKPNRLKATLRV